MTLREAHAQSLILEHDVRSANPQFERVNTHIESPEIVPQPQVDVTTQRAESIPEVRRIVERVAGAGSCRDVRMQWSVDEAAYEMVIQCAFPGNLTIAQVHLQTTLIEQQIHQEFPGISEILVHSEPATMSDELPAD